MKQINKLIKLRERWIKEPDNRRFFERMAKALKLGKKEKKLYGDDLVKTAEKIFKTH